MRIDVYPCGCASTGFRCPDHRRPPAAGGIITGLALALFCGMIAVWAAILG